MLAEQQLLWSGAIDGRVWRQRPLPLSFCRNCIFRKPALAALSKAGIAHVEIVDTQSDDAAMVAIAADLAVGADLSGSSLQGVAAWPSESLKIGEDQKQRNAQLCGEEAVRQKLAATIDHDR